MSLRLVMIVAPLVVACSSTPSTPDGGSPNDGSAPTDGSPSDAAPDNVAQSDSGDAALSSYTLAFPAQSLSPAEEQTLCITKRLGNTAAIHVGSITTTLDPGDFQIMVYLSTATTEQLTPQTCSPEGGLTDSTLQLVYIGRASDALTFPSGVGLTFGANQMVKIELHQYATQSASAGAQVTFGVMGDSSFQHEVALFVQFEPGFTIAPGIQSINGFNAIPSHMGAANVIAMTGFENALGTERKAWSAANGNDTSNQVYDSTTSFDQPTRKAFTSPLTFAGDAGIAYQCTYNNGTGTNVNSGPNRNDETCMFASYYYPGQGFELCAGTFCLP